MLRVVPQKTKSTNLIGKPSWEGIAEAVPGRTVGECRRRMDTLKKSYNIIEGYCVNQKKEFSQLNEEEFKVMMNDLHSKLASRFERSWYNYVRDYCPPRSCKKMIRQGAGGSLENGGNSVSCASTSSKANFLSPSLSCRSAQYRMHG